MLFQDNLMLALRSIWGNRLRTFLTFMIIAFGIMALVGILTAVDGIQAALSSNFATMGTNNFDIRKKGTGIQVGKIGRSRKAYPAISIDDAMAFKEKFDFPATVSISTIADMATTTVKGGNEKTNPNIQVFGGDENYLTIGGFDLEIGRNFSEQELLSGSAIAIIGNGMASKLFKKPNKAIDQPISINGQKYRVIGVLAAKGASSIFSSDNIVIIPLLKCRQQYGNDKSTYVITVMMNDTYDLDPAIAEATGLMRTIRYLDHREEDDFDISKSDKLSSMLLDQSAYVTTAATIIGIITLIGGAIGLMNIMLVAVSERIREIGISKALGAKKITILTQFLLEAIAICQLGGFLGVVLGIGAGNLVSVLVKGPFIIPWFWMFGGIVLCFAVGLLAGIYPALKAANVDPIESLRHE